MQYKDLPRDEETGKINALEVEFPIEFPLAAAVESGGVNVDTLSIREPNIGDVEISNREKDGLTRTMRLLSLVAELPVDDVRRMGTRDYARLQELLEVFL